MICNSSWFSVETYLTAANKTRDSLKCAATPFRDEDRLVEADDAVNTGALQSIASSVLMKVFYGARMAIFGLLKAVANLAKNVTTWNASCDKILHIDLLRKFFIRFASEGAHGRLLRQIGFISLQRRKFRWRQRTVKIYHGNLYGPHRSTLSSH